MAGQNILTGNKLYWDAILPQGTICGFAPDAIFCPEKMCFMDDYGVTVHCIVTSVNEQ